jgi:hypothetical protein
MIFIQNNFFSIINIKLNTKKSNIEITAIFSKILYHKFECLKLYCDIPITIIFQIITHLTLMFHLRTFLTQNIITTISRNKSSIGEARSFIFCPTKKYQSFGWAAVNVQAEDRVARNKLAPVSPHAE